MESRLLQILWKSLFASVFSIAFLPMWQSRNTEKMWAHLLFLFFYIFIIHFLKCQFIYFWFFCRLFDAFSPWLLLLNLFYFPFYLFDFFPFIQLFTKSVEVNSSMSGIVVYLALAIFPNTIMAGKIYSLVSLCHIFVFFYHAYFLLYFYCFLLVLLLFVWFLSFFIIFFPSYFVFF